MTPNGGGLQTEIYLTESAFGTFEEFKVNSVKLGNTI
jgi:hypothetical protein